MVERLMPVSLLARKIHRKFAVVDTLGQALGIARSSVFAIGRHQFGERKKQTRLRHAIAVHAIEACFRPRLMQAGQSHLFLLVIRYRLARRQRQRHHGQTAHTGWLFGPPSPERKLSCNAAGASPVLAIGLIADMVRHTVEPLLGLACASRRDRSSWRNAP